MEKWEWIERKSVPRRGGKKRWEVDVVTKKGVSTIEKEEGESSDPRSHEGFSGQKEGPGDRGHGRIVMRTVQLTSAPLAIKSRPIYDVSEPPWTRTKGRGRLDSLEHSLSTRRNV
jgi:hypothetical protein